MLSRRVIWQKRKSEQDKRTIGDDARNTKATYDFLIGEMKIMVGPLPHELDSIATRKMPELYELIFH